MKQYLAVLQQILNEGVEKESGRANMPNTIGISYANIKMDLQQGFPLLTTKKMFWKGIVHELLWILRGDTNIKYLVDNNVNIWNEDAYRWYLKYAELNGSLGQSFILYNNRNGSFRLYGKEEFIGHIKNDKDLGRYKDYQLGDLGKIYGYQWRRKEKVWNDEQGPCYENRIDIYDQVFNIIDKLKKNPYSRYHIIDAWDRADMDKMALPPCHLLYQFICRPLKFEERIQWAISNLDLEMENIAITEAVVKENSVVPKFYLDLNMYQRSCDIFLGVPFNIASMSLLLMIIAKTCNMLAGVANWIGGDTHIYLDHIKAVKEQLQREPLLLPKVTINKELNILEDIEKLTINDFELEEYTYHPAIKAELFTGLKK